MTSPAPEGSMFRSASGVVSPRHPRSRTQSVSSDRPSTVGRSLGLLSPPLSVSPEPAFIAASAAAQIVTNDHDSHAGAWYDQNSVEPAAEPALVSPAALQLVNAFLDQLLFNFLLVSRATALPALRPAVTEILKPKLAKDTITNADEELREYLGGGDEDDYFHSSGAGSAHDWDVELVWKRTRLRCMVYSSLGDLEEEDEDLYMEQESLEIGANEQASDVISPAVAIFLTSILEYMGELTLTVAGQAAYARVRAKIEKDLKDGTRNPSDAADRVVVDEMDMERVALDRTLGRLWRGWKKRMRYPGADVAGQAFSTAHWRQDYTASEALAVKSLTSESGSDLRRSQDHFDSTIAEDVEPMDIPLPQGDNDVEEIEVPGLTHYSDDEEDADADAEVKVVPRRPKSVCITPWVMANGLPTPTTSQPHTPVTASRKRSNSLPAPLVPSFYASSKRPRKTSKPASLAHDSGPSKPEEPQAVPSGRVSPETAEASSDLKTPAATMAKSVTAGKGHSNSNMVSSATLASAAGVAGTAMAGAAVVAQGRRDTKPKLNEANEVATYERAEILTSSRVSIAGSVTSTSTSSASDLGKASSVKRSSSVHSARIVDVSHKSASHSRATSTHAMERPDRASPTGVSSRSRASTSEDDGKPKAIEHGVGASVESSTSHALLDKRTCPRRAALPISESDEYFDGHATMASGLPDNAGPGRAVVLATGTAEESPSTRVKREQAAPGSGGAKKPFRRDHTPSHIKVSTPGALLEETIPEIPAKSPGHAGWQSPKADGRMASTERSRTKETDDELALPLQSNVTPRQIHTSASSASSGTTRLKPVRTSEENSSRAESVARNFEELIQSNQTITYTLTPENMRDIDSKPSLDSPVVTKLPKKSEEARGQQSPRSSPTAAEAPRSPWTHQPMSPKVADNKAGKASGTPLLASPGSSALAAREARILGESTADFAEFIKSTGPPGEKGPPPPPKANTPPPRKVNTPTSPAKSSIGSRADSTTSSHCRYQPRDAAIDSKADNSDLIDFIRQGPPTATSNHRIPRHVAPFRTTMDSDQLAGAVGGKAVDATIPEIRYSQGSTNLTDNSMPSMQSSINSNSALLKNRGASGSSNVDEEDGMPKRKQRRVRDPYAVDFSDEEGEEEDIVATPKPLAKEESLAEFLRNYEPPPEPASLAPRLPKKKSSAPSLMGRFTRNGSKDLNVAGNAARGAGVKQDSRSLDSRAGGKGGYIPIQVNIPPGYDKYGPTDNLAGRPRVTSTASSAARVPMKKFEPRDAVINKSQTADLAAFLRDSGPAEGASGGAPARAPPRQATSRQDESNGLSKMFGRKKKAGAS